ncbi:dihydropteroate synthase [Nakamurella panacisegetis]|uniref:Dihydropteroate synthase n=2 Tax=Nakamurella panacisegetis TaxID=1090615 RepID=A0A1H0SMF3_9ACTN|nr:dihydropteroate synthase [Nakamurella panacisegetis]
MFRGRALRTDRAAIMAIVNRTPDSFFDGGATFDDGPAMAAVDQAVADGADLVDIGGVKAGVGPAVDIGEEMRRVVPFVASVRAAHPDLIISVDTWRSEVATAACEAGADLINDTWAGVDHGLAAVAAEFGAGIVCSHTGGAAPRTNPYRVAYRDVVAAVVDETTAAAEAMVAAGVPKPGILIDPTHDFGKNTRHGLELIRRTPELVATGWPVLMALSNKDFVGETLGVALHERLEGTLAATAVAAMGGAAVFRAHQVLATRRVLEMVASIQGTREPSAPRRGMV